MLRQPRDNREALLLYQAMNRFKHTSDGQTIIKFLKSELKRLQNKNDNEDDTLQFRRRQGANRHAKKLLSMIEISHEEVEKLR